MKPIHSPALDLNLVKVFDALIETRNVSRAAELLGVSQSAVSHSLSRLRIMIGDPLFVRAGNRMEPTARAQRLAEPLRDVLLGAAKALTVEEDFSAEREERTFTIAALDSLLALLLPGVVQDAAQLRVSILVKSLSPMDTLEGLDEGTIDLAIGPFPRLRRWHESHFLYQDNQICLFDRRLVPVETPISAADYVRYPHIIPSIGDTLTSFVDENLAKLGLRRQVVAGCTQFLAIPFLLTQAPTIATLPARLAQIAAPALGLTVSPPPFPSKPVDVLMAWHRRHSSSPSHLWLRKRILQTASGMESLESASS